MRHSVTLTGHGVGCQYVIATHAYIYGMRAHARSASEFTDDSAAQHSPRVAFQGVPGAFSEQAIQQRWPNGAITVPGDTFAEALQHVTSGAADFAAIPVENAIAGPVEAAVNALSSMPALLFHGDIRVDIQLCLMSVPGATLEGVRTVHSHQMALAQSQRFFAQHPWLVPAVHSDTAAAARDVSRQGDPAVAAIASEVAATIYELDILARGVQDTPDNWTRFVIVSER